MQFDWSQDITSQLIDHYRNFSVLWDVRDRNHHNRDAVFIAYERLLALMIQIKPNATVEERSLIGQNCMKKGFQKEKKL